MDREIKETGRLVKEGLIRRKLVMYEEWFEKQTGYIQNNQNGLDRAWVGDPLAERIDWDPVVGHSSYFHNLKLVKVNPNRMEFRIRTRGIIVSAIFTLFGIAIFSSFFLIKFSYHSSDGFFGFLLFLLGLFLVGYGVYGFCWMMLPVVFDRQEGLFWRGPKPEPQMLWNESATYFARLESIHALQIVGKIIHRPKGGSFYCYELNLVLNNGSRINAIEGDKDELRDDTAILADFLGIPVWDRSAERIFDAY